MQCRVGNKIGFEFPHSTWPNSYKQAAKKPNMGIANAQIAHLGFLLTHKSTDPEKPKELFFCQCSA